MRLKITKTNSDTNYYVIKDIKTPSGKRTTMIYEKLGKNRLKKKLTKWKKANLLKMRFMIGFWKINKLHPIIVPIIIGCL